MVDETEKRKADHIRICLEKKAQAKKATAGFEDIQFVHRALPEVDRQKIALSTSFLGKKLAAPLIVGAMTGGTAEATKINAAIAQAVENLIWAWASEAKEQPSKTRNSKAPTRWHAKKRPPPS